MTTKSIRHGDRVVVRCPVIKDGIFVAGVQIRVADLNVLDLVDVEQVIRVGDRVRLADSAAVWEVKAVFEEEGRNVQYWLKSASEWPLRTVVSSAIAERVE